jgi:hypothetical protein
MLIELTEDTLQDLIARRKSSGSIFGIMVWQCRIMKQNSKLASENETITFALVDAEN